MCESSVVVTTFAERVTVASRNQQDRWKYIYQGADVETELYIRTLTTTKYTDSGC